MGCVRRRITWLSPFGLVVALALACATCGGGTRLAGDGDAPDAAADADSLADDGNLADETDVDSLAEDAPTAEAEGGASCWGIPVAGECTWALGALLDCPGDLPYCCIHPEEGGDVPPRCCCESTETCAGRPLRGRSSNCFEAPAVFIERDCRSYRDCPSDMPHCCWNSSLPDEPWTDQVCTDHLLFGWQCQPVPEP